MRILVVGAGPAGTRCAVRLAQRVAGAQVTLLGAELSLPYDRVALSKLLAGEAEVGDLITHPLAELAALGVTYRAGVAVVGIDRAARCVVTAKGERLAYDRLVLATGATPNRLPVPGANLPGVVAYRDMADVRAMLRAVRLGGRAVVIGGGLLGLEAATGLAARGMQVTVVHALGWPMERQLDPEAGGLLTRRLGRRGIRFVMPAATRALEGEGHVRGVRLDNGRLLPASLVVMSVGIRPNADLARQAGLEVNRGVVVDDAMRSSDPAIHAIGECAEHEGRVIGLVKPALEQAEVAAAAIAGEGRTWAPAPDAAALKVSGTAVWSAGEITAERAEAIILRDEESEHYRRLFLRDGRLVGAVLYGDTADAGFYLKLIEEKRPVPGRAALALGPVFAGEAA
jgi:nitrite reductase (NADH) large subunit